MALGGGLAGGFDFWIEVVVPISPGVTETVGAGFGVTASGPTPGTIGMEIDGTWGLGIETLGGGTVVEVDVPIGGMPGKAVVEAGGKGTLGDISVGEGMVTTGGMVGCVPLPCTGGTTGFGMITGDATGGRDEFLISS